MAAEEPPDSRQVPVVWTGMDEAPILFANGFFCQFDQDLEQFILTIGQLSPPALVGTPEDVKEQVERIDFIPVRTVSRVAFTPTRMQELIALLQANVDQRERVATLRPGDPR